MKNKILTLAFALSFAAHAVVAHELVKQWETEAVLKTPESVLCDAPSGVLYVSNIDGQEPWTKDGKGSIGKVGLDGKVIAVEWVTGLNGPKGMGLHDGKLYVADIDQIVVIDTAKAKIVDTIAIEGAQRLNDITVDPAGVVYVSDSKNGTVHAITDGKPALLLEKLKSVNGLLVHGGSLYVLADGALWKSGKDKTFVKLVDGMEGGVDGVEHVQGDEFIVSGWAGVVYLADVAKGKKEVLLDTRAQKISSADIGYDAKKHIVYVPTFFTNTIVAYEVK